jgi:hypothetical protein
MQNVLHGLGEYTTDRTTAGLRKCTILTPARLDFRLWARSALASRERLLEAVAWLGRQLGQV